MLKQILLLVLLIAYSHQACKQVIVESAGTDDGNKVKITFDGVVKIDYNLNTADNMGIHIITIKNTDLTVVDIKLFKLATNGLGNTSENQLLIDFVKAIPDNYYVLVAIKGGAQLTSQAAVDALKTLGAANWPELNIARINFALIGKKGSAAGTGMYSHKLRTIGPVKIEACLSETIIEVKCLEGEFFQDSTCKRCEAQCKNCKNADDYCTSCSDNFYLIGLGKCVPASEQTGCPESEPGTSWPKVNSICIEPQCLAELGQLKQENVDTECTEKIQDGTRFFNADVKLIHFPMKYLCHYSMKVYFKDNMRVEKEIPFTQGFFDEYSTLSFGLNLAQVVRECDRTDDAQQIHYKCFLRATLSAANYEQTDMFLVQNINIIKATGASSELSITKSEIKLCPNDDCTFLIPVPSKIEYCNSPTECGPNIPNKFSYIRNERITIKQVIDDVTLKDFYLKPKSITLYTDDGANIIPVKLSDAQIINSNKAEIIFSVPLTIAIGKCRIKVVSTVETGLTLMNFFQRILLPADEKKNAVVFEKEFTLTETVSNNKVDDKKDECDKDGLGPGDVAAIILGIFIIVTALGAGGYFFYRWRKQQPQKKYAEAEKV